MERTRNHYTPEFKSQILSELSSGTKPSIIAEKHKVSPQLIYKWNRAAHIHVPSKDAHVFARLEQALDEIETLKKYLGKLLLERYIGSESTKVRTKELNN